MEEEYGLPSEYYNSGKSDRKSYEDRAEEIAALTLPYVIRADGSDGGTELEDNAAQAYGAKCINTLKGKMGMALMPPSTSSFRYVPEPAEMAALSQGNQKNATKINAQLSTATKIINDEMELQQIRSSVFNFLLELMIVGSTIVEKIEKKGVRIHKLKSFIVTLDPLGFPLKMCIFEELAALDMPKDIQVTEEKDTYELYTMYQRKIDSDGWIRTQDIDGQIVGTEKSYKSYDSLPIRYLGWTWMTGDDYHRPYAEDYLNDLKQLDKLALLLTDGSLIAAKILLFVNERGGRTRKDEVAESVNGSVIDGSADDVTALTIGKNYDFQVPMERESNIKKELASAFLLNESATRDAERVTAEEIRFMAQELETSTLAGIYSVLSLHWSKWIIEKVMEEMKIKFDALNVEILTGLDALGRSQESQKLDGYLQRLAALEMLDYINKEELAVRYAAFDGIDTTNLLLDADVVQQNKMKAAEDAATAAGETSMAEAAGQGAGQAMTTPQ